MCVMLKGMKVYGWSGFVCLFPNMKGLHNWILVRWDVSMAQWGGVLLMWCRIRRVGHGVLVKHVMGP